MLDLFRRYQRYLYIVITVVIVISFSFFGTYSSLSNNSFREQIAFTTINGTQIPRHELDEMATFIATDSLDKLLFGGAWGPNFLNSGVIRRDFLETGLGAMLIAQYPSELQSDLLLRFEKEKRFTPYRNPQFSSIGVESAWAHFAPAMKTHYDTLKTTQHPLQQDAINARIALFLGERQFPAPLVRQVIRYQEKQHPHLQPDRALDQIDLSLYHYHNLEDWFGPRFTRLVAEFIINAAAIAEQKGYEVSKADALADLIRNAETNFEQSMPHVDLGVANSREYFNEQLRRLGLDANKATKIWRQVLLFQRYFQDAGSSVFVDPQTLAKIDSYSLEGVEGQLVQLPKALQLKDFKSLQKFETYLDAVSKRKEGALDLASLPSQFQSLSEIAKQSPELVQKRYELKVASVDKKTLSAKVTVRDSWNWEVEDSNWKALIQQFPELSKLASASTASSKEQRFEILDSLDDKTRGRIDAFARGAIVDAHPQWIEQALEEAPSQTWTIGLHEKGGVSPFTGLKDGKELMQLLDKAPLAAEPQEQWTEEAKEAAGKLANFTKDRITYYRISVQQRAQNQEIMTFEEADQEGILNALLEKKLESYYLKVRDAHPEFQQSNQNWKPFYEVQAQVADLYFAPLLKAIQTAYAKTQKERSSTEMIPDYAASLRFFPYVNKIRDTAQTDQQALTQWTKELASIENKAFSTKESPLADQWKLETLPYTTTRASAEDTLNHAEVFQLQETHLSQVNAPANGKLNFFRLDRKVSDPNNQLVLENIAKTRKLLSIDAQQTLMALTLKEIKSKNAISLEYLNNTDETSASEDDADSLIQNP